MFKKLTFKKSKTTFNGHEFPVTKVIYGEDDITILAAQITELPLFFAEKEWRMCAIHSTNEIKGWLDPHITSRELRNVPIAEIELSGKVS